MSLNTQNNYARRRHLRHLVIFAMFAALMFVSKQVMAALPNIHLIGMFVILLTVVYRSRALIPIYTFVLLEGVIQGFSPWWVPYLYIWALLWGASMLIPRSAPLALRAVLYPALCALHGLLFGSLYAPVYALLFGLNFEEMLSWIVAGFGFDLLHTLGNFAVGLLILPLSKLLLKLEGR